jgi:hypothetical protein
VLKHENIIVWFVRTEPLNSETSATAQQKLATAKITTGVVQFPGFA